MTLSRHIQKMLRTLLFWALVLGTGTVLAGVLYLHWQTPASSKETPSATLQKVDPPFVPKAAMRAYRQAEESTGTSWKLLAAIGKAESEHGKSPLPGVRSGINSAGCCAGPMQLCVTDSCGNVASTYARDGDGDGSFSVYEIDDAAATAGAYLSWMEDFLGSNEKLLAAGYNAGPTIVSQRGVPPYPETKAYVRSVLETLKKLENFE